MVSLPNVISADMTTAIRTLGTEVAREVYASPTKLLSWAVSGHKAPPNAGDSAAVTSHPTTNFVIVDRALTRC